MPTGRGPGSTAKGLGLEGKMTATIEGAAFKRLAEPILDAIGPYPHAELHAMTNGRKKQVARLVKCECPECGYVARASPGNGWMTKARRTAWRMAK